MKIFGVTIELKLTLGQVVTAIILIASSLIWLGGTYVKLQAMEKRLDEVPTRTELVPVFKSIDSNIGLISSLVIAHVAQTGTASPQTPRVGLETPSGLTRSGHPDSLHSDTQVGK